MLSPQPCPSNSHLSCFRCPCVTALLPASLDSASPACSQVSEHLCLLAHTLVHLTCCSLFGFQSVVSPPRAELHFIDPGIQSSQLSGTLQVTYKYLLNEGEWKTLELHVGGNIQIQNYLETDKSLKGELGISGCERLRTFFAL